MVRWLSSSFSSHRPPDRSNPNRQSLSLSNWDDFEAYMKLKFPDCLGEKGKQLFLDPKIFDKYGGDFVSQVVVCMSNPGALDGLPEKIPDHPNPFYGRDSFFELGSGNPATLSAKSWPRSRLYLFALMHIDLYPVYIVTFLMYETTQDNLQTICDLSMFPGTSCFRGEK